MKLAGLSACFEISGSVNSADDHGGPLVSKPEMRLVHELLGRLKKGRD